MGDETIFKVDLEAPEHKDKGENVPPVGSPRWNEIYGKLKATERELATVKEELAKAKPGVEYDALLQHNQQLAEAIEKLSTTLDQRQEPTVDPLKEVNAKIADLRGKKSAAIAAADYKTAGEIDAQLDEAKDEKLEIQLKAAQPKPQGPPPDLVVAAKRFGQENPEIISDPGAMSIATGIETMLRKDPAWQGKSHAEIFTEVGIRTKKFLGMENPNQNNTNLGVDGAGFSGNNGGAGGKGLTQVTLTADEIAAAHFTGVSPEQYAKQKALIAKARGGK